MKKKAVVQLKDLALNASGDFDVEVCRTGYGHRTLRITGASSPEDAEQRALDEAGNHEYNENHSDYSVESVTRVAPLVAPPATLPPLNASPMVAQIILQCGDDLWAQCKQFPRDNWQQEVANGDTVAGYWDWVLSEAEATAVDLDSLCAAA